MGQIRVVNKMEAQMKQDYPIYWAWAEIVFGPLGCFQNPTSMEQATCKSWSYQQASPFAIYNFSPKQSEKILHK